MHRFLSAVLVLAWGLWFGAIGMVFLTVTSLFATFADQRAVAGAAAAGVFRRFEILQLVAGGVAFVAALTLRWRAARRPFVLPALLLFSVILAMSSAFVITPKIDALRRAGEPSSSAEFKSLHGTSSALYLTQAILLLTTGLFLPGFLKRTEISPATAPA